MKTTLPILAMSLMTASAMADKINFDDAKTGAPPPGWAATKTGSGSPKWTIEKDAARRANRTS